MNKELKFPLVSVIIPIYNIQQYIGECLKSICTQSLTNIEIICIDDGSTDDSFDIVNSYATQDTRIRVFRQENQGVSTARNNGLRYAHGKYILFVDGDDWIDSFMLQNMISEAEKNNADIVICSSKVHFPNEKNLSLRNKLYLTSALKTTNGVFNADDNASNRWKLLDKSGSWPFIWNKLIRRDILVKHKISFSENLSLGEDGIFLQILFQYVNKVQYLRQKLYHYRYLRANSATIKLALNRTTRIDNHIKVTEELINELQTRGLLESNSKFVLRWILRFLYGDIFYLIENERKKYAAQLYDMFTSYDILQYQSSLTPIERRCLKNLLSAENTDCKWKTIFDYLTFKIQAKLVSEKNKKGI